MKVTIVLGVIGVVIATDLQTSFRTPPFDRTHRCPCKLERVTAGTAHNHRGVISCIGIRLATLGLPGRWPWPACPPAPGAP